MALKTARKRSNARKRKGTPRRPKPVLQTQAKRRAPRRRPGIKKPASQMTPAEMRRKGSWATRFYGRKRLPRLVDAQGRPTRFALTAPDWGEPVPRTVAAARRIAAKGRTLLQRYQRSKLR